MLKILLRFFKQGIKATGFHVLLKPLVPSLRPKLRKPFGQLRQLGRRQLSNGGFDFLNIHIESLAHFPAAINNVRRASTPADRAAHRLDELRRVVADAVLEDDFYLLDVGDVSRRVAADDYQVGLAAGGDCADAA